MGGLVERGKEGVALLTIVRGEEGRLRGGENDGRQLQSALISMIMICH